MATLERQCPCFSLPLPLLTFFSLLLLSFLFLANSQPAAPSSRSFVAAGSSQFSYPLRHDQHDKLSTSDQPFIHAAVVSSSPTAGILSLHADFPQKKEALFLDDDDQEAPISTPAFIYESVAASFDSRSHADGLHWHGDKLPWHAEAAIIDDENTELQGKPSYIYESVIADHSTPSKLLPSNANILHNNVPQEEHAFLHDDGTHNLLLQKKEDSTIAKPSYIYESVAASIHSEARDAAIHSNVPQEEKGFLLDDGGKHVNDVRKEAMPIKGEQFIHEYVASQLHTYLVDDGSIKHVDHDSPLSSFKEKDSQSSRKEEHVLHDNASQGEYSFLRDDGGKRDLHINKLPKDKDDGMKNDRTTPIYPKLRMARKHGFNEENLKMVVDSQPAFGVHDGKNNEEISLRMVHEDEDHPMTDIRMEDPRINGNLRMVVDDNKGDIEVEDNSSKEEGTLKMVVGDSPNGMIQSDSPKSMEQQGYRTSSNNLRMVVDNNKGDIGVEDKSHKEESTLKMVVGDSPNGMIQSDSPKSMEQQRYRSSSNNLRMVVDDDDASKMLKKGPFSADRGRSRSCSSIVVCQELAHAEHLVHIALYGQMGGPRSEKNLACCRAACVDLNTDLLNCGACGTGCDLSQTCCNGKCTDLNTDSHNCGQCGHSCPSSYPCQFGMCGYY